MRSTGTIVLLLVTWIAASGVGKTSLAAEKRKYQFGRKAIEFLPLGPEGEYLSSDCGRKKCQAVQALKRATLQGLESLFDREGINLGAAVCQLKVQGTIELGEDQQEQFVSFCRLSDGSLVGNSDLLRSAHENDKLGVEKKPEAREAKP